MPTIIPKILLFFGFTGFYQQFIRGYSSIAMPLTIAVKSKVIKRLHKKDLTKTICKV
jgi:hypothetical protein